MLKTYFKLALRSVLKNKTFSFINIVGLAIGLTCCQLISLYLVKEFSYDSQHAHGDRLYQLGTFSAMSGREGRSGHTPAPMAPAMQQQFPEIEAVTRIIPSQDDKTLLQYNTGHELRSFYEDRGFHADSTFFRLFTYPFVEGDPNTALNEPNTVVLSRSIASKLFGSEPALNKIIHINSNMNGSFDFRVTGVYAPSPTPSHIDARFVMSMKGGEVGDWISGMTDMVNNNMFFSYLLLKPGADPARLSAKFPAFIEQHAGAELKASGRTKVQYLTKVTDIHLHADDGNVTPAGSLSYLYILLSIAIVTLLIACVNFMNLSTARSSKRAVEIGVRKVLGAEKTSLVRQFLWEAVLLSLIAFVLASLFTYLMRPLLERVSGQTFLFSGSQYALLSGVFLLVSLLAGLIAGLYPAFYLSAFKPVKVLKGKFSNSLAAINLRQGLVVFQFVISVALIVASLTIGNQMHYLRTTDLGFEKDQQVIIPLRTASAKSSYLSLRNEIAANPTIGGAGASAYYPGIANPSDWLMYKQGMSPDQTRDVYINRVDESYLQTIGVKLLAGRLFSREFPGDTSNGMVLNEKAVKEFGFASAEDAVGKNIAATRSSGEVLFPIVGVVRDFHFEGLQSAIQPYGFLRGKPGSFNYVVAHAKGGHAKTALSSLAGIWGHLNPNEAFEYSFLDQDFQKNYEAEDRLSSIIRSFTIIAILISCLGLFGLTTFTVEQRTKEIGIRKVLGATTAGLVSLLSKDFLRLVVLSFLLAAPLSWYFIHKWLEDFAYKAPFTIWIVLAGCGAALLIAFLTISIQSVRVALTNPVQNLRTE
ncbi:MAG: antimicrobial peptide transporter permease [Flaviaesturariibacter sp.]|nr:antimicrobial peptide transporter permease [Flaviaesturariibacter sp.]